MVYVNLQFTYYWLIEGLQTWYVILIFDPKVSLWCIRYRVGQSAVTWLAHHLPRRRLRIGQLNRRKRSHKWNNQWTEVPKIGDPLWYMICVEINEVWLGWQVATVSPLVFVIIKLSLLISTHAKEFWPFHFDHNLPSVVQTQQEGLLHMSAD